MTNILENIRNKFLSLTTDPVAIGYCRVDETVGHIVDVNEGFELAYGYTRDDAVGRPSSLLHDPDHWQEFTEAIAPELQGGSQRIQAEAACQRADGSKFWASVSIIFLDRDESGGRYSIAVYRDITVLRDREVAAETALLEMRAALAREQETLAQISTLQSRFTAAMQTFPDPMGIYDSDGRLIACNAAYSSCMSNDRVSMEPGQHFREIYSQAMNEGLLVEPPEGRDALFERIERANQAGRAAIVEHELPNDIHHRMFGAVADNGDVIVVRSNVTELVRQRREARENEDRLTAAIQAFPGPFCIYDSDLRLLRFNQAYRDLYKDETEEIVEGVTLGDVLLIGLKNGLFEVAEEDVDAWLKEMLSLRSRNTGYYDMNLADDRHFRAFVCWNDSGDMIRAMTDITALVRQTRALEESSRRLTDMNQAITHRALHDELTGLGNRRFLTQKLEELVQRHEVEGGDVSVLNMDLDRFKQINDTMGHAAGDFVLKTVAERLRALTGPNEWSVRNGGDEFVVLISEETVTKRPEDLARILIAELPKPVAFNGRDCRFGVSVGVASTPLSKAQELMTNSDLALYRAKRSGRGRVGVFNTKDLSKLREKQRTADEILSALEQGEFEPYYQPQVDARTGDLVGLEALARWRHPTRGILAPDAFLSIADDLSVVPKIDQMIFEKAIDQCGRLFCDRAKAPSLSFNVSTGRVKSDDLTGIAGLVACYPGKVVFELLETIFLEEEDAGFLMQLDRLREMGLAIEVDDFGSGRASIVALQRIGPDRLKIDRRLVAPVTQSEKAQRLVRSIIEIGSALDIGVVAEGVETAEHGKILADMGVERLQGYFFAPPLPLAGLHDYLSATRLSVSR